MVHAHPTMQFRVQGVCFADSSSVLCQAAGAVHPGSPLSPPLRPLERPAGHAVQVGYGTTCTGLLDAHLAQQVQAATANPKIRPRTRSWTLNATADVRNARSLLSCVPQAAADPRSVAVRPETARREQPLSACVPAGCCSASPSGSGFLRVPDTPQVGTLRACPSLWIRRSKFRVALRRASNSARRALHPWVWNVRTPMSPGSLLSPSLRPLERPAGHAVQGYGTTCTGLLDVGLVQGLHGHGIYEVSVKLL